MLFYIWSNFDLNWVVSFGVGLLLSFYYIFGDL